MMTELIEQIYQEHRSRRPLANSQSRIERAELRIGRRLPDDLRLFYQHCDGAVLFDGVYTILEVDDLVRVSTAICGAGSDDICPPSWYALCDVQDGNYVAIDLNSLDGERYPVIDCFHETLGLAGDYHKVVALSFTEFLQQALTSNGTLYWLASGFKGYGDALG